MSAPKMGNYGKTAQDAKSKQIGFALFIGVIIIFLLLLAQPTNAQSSCPAFKYDSARTPFLLFPSFESLGIVDSDGNCAIKLPDGRIIPREPSFVLAFEQYRTRSNSDGILPIGFVCFVDPVGPYGGNIVKQMLVLPLEARWNMQPSPNGVLFSLFRWDEIGKQQALNHLQMAVIIDKFSNLILFLPSGDGCIIEQDSGFG